MYLALYRKYRPKTFDDVISQEHITTTLKNQIINKTTAHAYLFTGSRGTGKTTCAKILAMAVNCLNPRDGNPCLECEACREIDSGAATDIVEMDAASNNGVDDVRQLRDEVAYTPVSCKYRVYIIDEVHMLSPQAFNALLKTLEEPPEHVKFILATTELHKVLPTIVSRCQRFDFRRVDIRDSANRLLSVAEKENVALDEDAAELISRLSDGGMRDALSVLDRCISADSHVTAEIVRNCAGVADNKHLFGFSEMVAAKDVSGCIRLLSELHNGSKDIARIIDELSGHYRDLMLYKTIPADTDLLSAMPSEYPELERISAMYTLDDILRCLSLLQQCADNIGKTKQRKTLAEMCLVKMCLGLGVQSESAAPRTYSSVQTAAVSANGAVSSGAAISVVPVEMPKEEFKPTPLENMSAKEAETVSKSRALFEETLKIVNETKANSKRDSQKAPAPVQNSVPAAPETISAPLDGLEPPPETEPQREFETAPKPIENPAPESKPLAKPMRNVSEKKAAEKPPEAEKPAEETAIPVSNDNWQEIVGKMSSPINRIMLKGSTVRKEGVTLVVSSSNPTFATAAKKGDYADIEDEISAIVGGRVHIRLVPEDKTGEDKTTESAVGRLLEKAKQLNIEIIYK
jgi:DNA polymerase-3 subunit gamma/tau